MPMGITRVADQYGFLPEAERHRENLASVHEEAMQIATAHSGHRITPGLNDPRRMAAEHHRHEDMGWSPEDIKGLKSPDEPPEFEHLAPQEAFAEYDSTGHDDWDDGFGGWQTDMDDQTWSGDAHEHPHAPSSGRDIKWDHEPAGEPTLAGELGAWEGPESGGYFSGDGDPLMSGPEMRSEQYHDDLSAQESAIDRHYGDDY